ALADIPGGARATDDQPPAVTAPEPVAPPEPEMAADEAAPTEPEAPTPGPAGCAASAPQPAAAPAATATPAAIQLAARSGENGSAPSGRSVRVPFPAGDAVLTESGRAALDGLVGELRSAEAMRVQLLAYAGDGEGSPSKARRLSLSRALAIRSHLMESGIKSSRIDVRALGDKVPSGPPDRVDVTVIER
ncbi:MAG: OmpA family protein, partial [Rhodospirillales bacterium]